MSYDEHLIKNLFFFLACIDMNVTAPDGLSTVIRSKIIALCHAIVPHVEIWLYGSRARGDYTASSDIDLALMTQDPIPLLVMAELHDVLQAAYIPYAISIIDLHNVSDKAFAESIQKDKILWNN